MRRAVSSIDTGAWLQGLLWGAFVYGVHKYGVLAGFYLTYSWFQMITEAQGESLALQRGDESNTLFSATSGRALIFIADVL